MSCPPVPTAFLYTSLVPSVPCLACSHDLLPTHPLPSSRHPSPLSASHPGSCSLVQLGQCNLLKKKPYNLVNHTSRGSGQGGESGAGLGGPHPQLRALVHLYLSLRTPAYSLELHSAANRVQSWGFPNGLHRGFRRVPGPLHVLVSLSDNGRGACL